MMTPFPPKTPTQMRREAEQRGKPKRRLPKPGPVDPARRPVLDGANWAAFLRTGSVNSSHS
jgi:hypothetical protein